MDVKQQIKQTKMLVSSIEGHRIKMAAPSMQTPAGNPEFVRLDSKYMCQKCQGVVREAMQTPCGHRLCQNCVNEMFVDDKSKVQCPANDEDCTEMSKEEVCTVQLNLF